MPLSFNLQGLGVGPWFAVSLSEVCPTVRAKPAVREVSQGWWREKVCSDCLCGGCVRPVCFPGTANTACLFWFQLVLASLVFIVAGLACVQVLWQPCAEICSMGMFHLN